MKPFQIKQLLLQLASLLDQIVCSTVSPHGHFQGQSSSLHLCACMHIKTCTIAAVLFMAYEVCVQACVRVLQE